MADNVLAQRMFPFDIKDLGASFKRYFEIVPALTPALRDEAFRIRHRVYCEELQFEPSRPDGREMDEYDAHSLQCLIRSVKSGEFVGCTRVIFCRPGNPHYPFPFERTCEASLDRSIVDPQELPRHTIAEVSRLAVVRSYRLRRDEHRSPAPMISEESFGRKEESGDALPRFPYIPVALYLATTELAALHGIDTLFVLTEPKLARHFARLGVNIRRIGAPVDHRGIRVPSALDVREILDGLNFIMRPLHEEIAGEVRRGIAAQREQPGYQSHVATTIA